MTWSRSRAGVRPCWTAARRVRGCSGNSTGRPSLASSSRMAWSRRCGSSVFSGRWMVARTYWLARRPRRRDQARFHVVRGHLVCGLDDGVASQADGLTLFVQQPFVCLFGIASAQSGSRIPNVFDAAKGIDALISAGWSPSYRVYPELMRMSAHHRGVASGHLADDLGMGLEDVCGLG